MGDYQTIYQEEKEKQLVLWKDMVVEIFGKKPGKDVEVTEKDQIISILDEIGVSKALNHTFMPHGGGLDLSGARYSNEAGLVEMNFGGAAIIVNPLSLTFHQIGITPEWWYFRLDTLPFQASGVYEEYNNVENEDILSETDKHRDWFRKYYGEEVLEVGPGAYHHRSLWELNHLGYDDYGYEIPLPEHARLVTRKYNGGAFVIFPKFSAYNNNTRTYDGRHNKMNNEGFHRYITKIVAALNTPK